MDQERRSPHGADATTDTAPGATETPGMESTTRIGIYFSAREFTAAKSAFLADWASGGDCDTFVKWVASALDQYAEHPAQQRAARERAPRTASEQGTLRSFDLPTHTANNVRVAISGDEHLGRRVNVSGWASDAIHVVVQDARRRTRGVLPVPPIRLPNRLTR